MQIRNFLLTSALYLSLAGAAMPAMAEERREERRDPGERTLRVGDDSLRFTLSERAVLESSLSDERGGHRPDGPKKLPPGLQKKLAAGKALPPGWQHKLARGDVLPGDVRAAARPLPAELSGRLPAGPEGTVVLEIDGEFVRVVQDTMEIIDILRALD